MVLAGLVGLPLSVSAQAGEEDSLSSWQVDEGASLEQPAPEKPALELKLDEAGVEVIARTPEEADAYRRVDRAHSRVDRAWNGFLYGGLIAGGSFIGAGAIVLGGSYLCVLGECEKPESPGAFNAGLILMAVGAAAMITSGVVYGVRNRQLRKHKRELWGSPYTHYGTPRRVQWDLAQSRLVF